MPRALIVLLSACFLGATPVALAAQDYTPPSTQQTVTLGFGRLFTNDALGDGHDRWRTGSYTVSMIRGTGWQGALPDQIGALLEYRVRTEIIAPANLAAPLPTDRRYVGALSAGVHTHFARGAAEMRLGADLVAIGPQTGVGSLQRKFHQVFGMTQPGNLSTQLPNHIYPTVSAEIGQSYVLGAAHLRPFIEAQAGVESYIRVGGDFTFGSFGQGAMMLRDQVTGQRFTGVRGTAGPGLSVTLGGDVARVFDNAYLPAKDFVESSINRTRLRAGVNWRGEKSEVFYGVTHLGREFEGQPSGQTLGSLRLHIRF